MKNSYFFKVWQKNKLLFGFLICFVLGQIFFSYKGVETLPFFNYGMYSAPLKEKELYSRVSIYNEKDQYIDLQTKKASRLIHYQLTYYANFVEQNYQDPTLQTIQSRFGSSNLSEYLVQCLTNNKNDAIHFSEEFLIQKIKIKKLKIFRENFKWVKNNFKKVNSKQLN